MAVSTSPPADLSAALVLEPVAAADWLVILPVAWCLAIGALLVMLRRPIGLHPFIAIAGLAGLVVIDGLLLHHVIASGPVTMVMGRWLPPFGIAFTVDLTGALFALAASVVALAGGIYSLSDINDSGRRYGFYPFLMLLMAGVSGAFLTGDIFNLYVWFEVLLISSFGLIVLGSEREQIDGAVKYGFLNLVATTLFLVTTGYLYASFGTLNMADIARKAEGLRGTAPLMTLTALFLLAFGMKAAAFPVNFWLPASYHTPRVVVSALFAGLLTKVGIYALIRVTVMLLPVEREELSFVIAVIGALTMLVGVFGALAQSDFRRMLGYLVISGIGSILAGVAVGGPGGIGGAIFYALHSMLVMTALYFASGVAAKLGGSFSLSSLSGLYRRHAGFAAISLMLAFAVSGLPPFSGFWPKVMLVKAALDIGAWWLAATLLVTGFLTTIATGRFFLFAYWRDTAGGQGAADKAQIPATILLPLAVLTLLALAIGLYPEPLLATIQNAAAGLSEPSGYLNSVFPGSRAMIKFLWINLVFTAIWAAISGSLGVPNLLLGFAVGALSLWLIRRELQPVAYPVRPLKILLLTALFFKELAVSATKVAFMVVQPKMRLKPGIFSYPLTVKSDFEIALLANLITLTPGTLSVDVSEDRKTLYVHALDCADPGGLRRDIANGFERRIKEAFE